MYSCYKIAVTKKEDKKKNMKTYELIPTNNQKSFYDKALITVSEDGTETLYSYGTKIISRNTDGKLKRYWNGWTITTGKHIRSFCGIGKKDFLSLPIAEER